MKSIGPFSMKTCKRFSGAKEAYPNDSPPIATD
jgi:hypothetical protein